MTPVKSLAASVAALGFASGLAAPLPAFGASSPLNGLARTVSMPVKGAPAPCERVERYAAQAEAELLRIERLDLRGGGKREHGAGVSKRDTGERPSVVPSESAGDVLKQLDADESAEGDTASEASEDDPSDESGSTGSGAGGGAGGAAVRGSSDSAGSAAVRGSSDSAASAAVRGSGGSAAGMPAERFAPIALRVGGKGDAKRIIGDVGVGDARTVMIADAPVKSAAAGLILDGRVAGAPAAEQVLQQAPPTHAGPTEQHTGLKRFGPLQVGAGSMSAIARWDAAMGCGAVGGEISRSTTELDQVTLTGANGVLVRVPERASSLSSTALSRRGVSAESVASATVSAGRIDLAGGEVRIRILRAPTLRVSMSAADGGEVDYQPAVVEVSGPGVSRTRLDTSSDRIDVTIGDLGPVTESGTVSVLPSQASPLPSIPGLPVPSVVKPDSGTPALESAPAGKAIVRVSLGDVRQASKGHALAARVTAVKVSVLRVSGVSRGRTGYASPAAVADLGIGMLEAAAVAPEPGRRSVESGKSAETLPVTGPRVAPMFVTGAGLLAAGVCAMLLGARRRRREP